MPSDAYLIQDGEESGPFSPAELKRMAAAGQIGPNDLIKRGSSGQPTPARTLSGLVDSLKLAAKRRPSLPPLPPPLPSVSVNAEDASVGASTQTSDIYAMQFSPSRNLADLQRKISGLRQTIVSCVLDESMVLSLVPALEKFRRDHYQLLSEIEAARNRIGNVEAARDRYIAASGRRDGAKALQEEVQKDLAKLYRPLGAAAFADLQVADHPQPHKDFANRLAIQQRILSLQKEYDSLAPRHERGIAAKVKAKGRQLAVAAKLKSEELKAFRCDETVGRRLVETGKADSLIGERTANIVQQIAAAKADLTAAQEHLETAQREFQRTTEQISRSLPLEKIDGVVTFNREISSLYARIKSKQQQMDQLEEQLFDQLLSQPLFFKDTPLHSSLLLLSVASRNLREIERSSILHRIAAIPSSLLASAFASSKPRPLTARRFAIRGTLIFAVLVGLSLVGVIIISVFPASLRILRRPPLQDSILAHTAEHGGIDGQAAATPKAIRVAAPPKKVDGDNAMPPVRRNAGQGFGIEGTPAGRQLEVRIGTAGGTDVPWFIVKNYNPSLKSVQAYATDDHVTISFDVDVAMWNGFPSKKMHANWILPLLVRLFDRNGNHLTHFTTAEGFTPLSDTYNLYHKRYAAVERMRASTGRDYELPRKPVLLDSQGNKITYEVNIRDLRDAEIVEIGFLGPSD